MKNAIQLFLGLFILQLLVSCSPTQQLSHKKSPTIDRDTLSFEITAANNIIFKTLLNGVDTLDLFFDTGGTGVVLKHSSIKDKTSLLNGKNENYKGENYVPLEELNTIALGNLSWDSITIYPVSLQPADTDGNFGWDLFEDKVVELDYDNNQMIVHSSFGKVPKDYSQLEIEYINTLFCIKGDMVVEGQTYANRYLFDTGFQRAVIMDKDLRKENNFPENLPVLKESTVRNSEGKAFVNKVVLTDKICFDKACAPQIPVQLLSTPNPARFETHILGNELLKRFNTILDFQNHVVYLKANQLISEPYIDAS